MREIVPAKPYAVALYSVVMPKARPRYYLVPRRGSGWYVVSCYAEEDVVECICDTEQAANDAIPKVRAFREDQNEAPRIVVEHHA